MTAVDELLANASAPAPPGGSEPPRDRLGRYLLPGPDGNRKAHTRATTIARTLADEYKLGQWQQRMVATGLARRQDLLLAVAAHSDDRDRLDELCEQAKVAAQADAGANAGTALHAATERADRGEDITLPPPWNQDLAAYQATLARHGVEVVPGMIERVVSVDSLGVAGTFDRLVRLPGACPCHGEPFELPLIADLKTAKRIYDFGEIALQLALYANADRIHDWAAGTAEAMPDVDRRHALVIHLPSGQATCRLHLLDIEEGWEGVQLAMGVRRYRKYGSVVELAPAAAEDTAAGSGGAGEEPGVLRPPDELPGPDPQAVAAWVETCNPILRVRLAKALDALGNVLPVGLTWPERVRKFPDGGPSTIEGVRLVEAFVNHLESHLGWPFDAPLPPEPTAPEPADTLPPEPEFDVDPGDTAVDLLAPWHVDEQRALVLAATGGAQLNPPQLAELHVRKLELLIGGLDAGYLTLAYAEDGTVSIEIPPAAEVAVLRRHGDSKALVLAAAKDAARALGRPVPRSAAQACTDPVLVTALATGHPSTNPPPTGENR